jgi:hypothetical protein
VYLDADAQVTCEDVCYTWTITEPGTYTATEEDRDGWTAQGAISHNFIVTSGSGAQSHTFVNFQDVEITVCKEDTEGDPIAGWGVNLDDDEQVTGADGCYTWTVTEPGTYTATEEDRDGWTATAPITHDFVITSGMTEQSHTFVNFQNVDVTVCKEHAEGYAIPGWKVYLDDDEQLTGSNGCYTWTITAPGTYDVTEEARTGWAPVGVNSYQFTAVSGGSYGPYTFVNTDKGTLIVQKVVINNDGAGLDCEDFSFQVDGGSAIAFEEDCQNELTVLAGTYDVTEPAAAGYSTSYDNCDDIVVPPGGSATCTITNNDLKLDIDIEKYVSVDNGVTWEDADDPTGPFATAGNTVKFKFLVTNTGEVVLSNIALQDTDFDLSSCTIPSTLPPGGSFDCIKETTAVLGQHTNTGTVDVTFTYGTGDLRSDSDSDDANYYGMNRGQPSIQINSLSIIPNSERTEITGTFGITDESSSGNKPDGFLIALTDYDVTWEIQKKVGKTVSWLRLATDGECTYVIVSVDYDEAQMGSYVSGDVIIFDEAVTIGYACTFDPEIPDKSVIRGTVTARIFNRDNYFTFSNTYTFVETKPTKPPKPSVFIQIA